MVLDRDKSDFYDQMHAGYIELKSDGYVIADAVRPAEQCHDLPRSDL